MSRWSKGTGIALSRDRVEVVGDRMHEIWWRGRQWAVTAHGVEALDGSYAITHNRLLEELRTHPWPMHMAEKDWVDIDEFATAWLIAILLSGQGRAPILPHIREWL
jgi:hypothetical protein